MEMLNVEWEGPCSVGFDEDGSVCLTKIRKLVKSSLSKTKREQRTTAALAQRQRHLEALMNEHLLRLDVHNSALRHDRRRLETINMGLGAGISMLGEFAQIYSNEAEEKIERERSRLQAEEKTKQEEITNRLDSLKNELDEKRAEADRLEKRVKILEERNKTMKQRQEQYNRYEEWIALVAENNELVQEMNEIERKIHARNEEHRRENQQRYTGFAFESRNPEVRRDAPHAPWNDRKESPFFPRHVTRFNR